MRISGVYTSDNVTKHPLDVLLWATVHGTDGERWLEAYTRASNESQRVLELDRLMRFYPQLGESVREYPALASVAESHQIVARAQRFQLHYRREIHASVWRVLSEVFEQRGAAAAKILQPALAGSGL